MLPCALRLHPAPTAAPVPHHPQLDARLPGGGRGVVRARRVYAPHHHLPPAARSGCVPGWLQWLRRNALQCSCNGRTVPQPVSLSVRSPVAFPPLMEPAEHGLGVGLVTPSALERWPWPAGAPGPLAARPSSASEGSAGHGSPPSRRRGAAVRGAAASPAQPAPTAAPSTVPSAAANRRRGAATQAASRARGRATASATTVPLSSAQAQPSASLACVKQEPAAGVAAAKPAARRPAQRRKVVVKPAVAPAVKEEPMEVKEEVEGKPWQQGPQQQQQQQQQAPPDALAPAPTPAATGALQPVVSSAWGPEAVGILLAGLGWTAAANALQVGPPHTHSLSCCARRACSPCCLVALPAAPTVPGRRRQRQRPRPRLRSPHSPPRPTPPPLPQRRRRWSPRLRSPHTPRRPRLQIRHRRMGQRLRLGAQRSLRRSRCPCMARTGSCFRCAKG